MASENRAIVYSKFSLLPNHQSKKEQFHTTKTLPTPLPCELGSVKPRTSRNASKRFRNKLVPITGRDRRVVILYNTYTLILYHYGDRSAFYPESDRTLSSPSPRSSPAHPTRPTYRLAGQQQRPHPRGRAGADCDVTDRMSPRPSPSPTEGRAAGERWESRTRRHSVLPGGGRGTRNDTPDTLAHDGRSWPMYRC